jgi:hypothetical protein
MSAATGILKHTVAGLSILFYTGGMDELSDFRGGTRAGNLCRVAEEG